MLSKTAIARTIEWFNSHEVTFGSIKLLIDDHYYVVNSGRGNQNLKVFPGHPITTFYDLYKFPLFAGVKQDSKVQVVTRINDKCIGKDDNYANTSMEETFFKYGVNPLSSTPMQEDYFGSSMDILEDNLGNSTLNYWQSSRGDFSHTYTLTMVSGPYEGDDGLWYDLHWGWTADESTVNSGNLKIREHGSVTLTSMNLTGAAINVTPNKPFVIQLYKGDAKVSTTIENVTTAAGGDKLDLKVTSK